jgi:hypothetical protein
VTPLKTAVFASKPDYIRSMSPRYQRDFHSIVVSSERSWTHSVMSVMSRREQSGRRPPHPTNHRTQRASFLPPPVTDEIHPENYRQRTQHVVLQFRADFQSAEDKGNNTHAEQGKHNHEESTPAHAERVIE